jgi:Tfp pilus assembly protein PilO
VKDRFFAALLKADPRVVWLGMIVVAALGAFEGWYLVLRTPLAQYQQLHATRVGLEAVAAASPREPAELTQLAAEVQSLAERLKGELRAAQSDEQLTARLMTELDQSALSRGAALKAVKHGGHKPVGPFDEVSFDVSAEGKYLKLSGWLLDLERVLGPSAAITELSMKATDTREAAVTLKLALYRGNAAPQGK